MNITAKLNDYRQSPRKVRLVAKLICGKKAEQAIDILTVTIKRASDPILGLLKSAIANAKNNFSLDAQDLYVKTLTVDNGAILYRRMPKARGMATPIRKRVSHVTLVLSVKDAEVKPVVKAEKVVAKAAAPKVKKLSKKVAAKA
jgi:large subunit ribosomal protein L22